MHTGRSNSNGGEKLFPSKEAFVCKNTNKKDVQLLSGEMSWMIISSSERLLLNVAFSATGNTHTISTAVFYRKVLPKESAVRV